MDFLDDITIEGMRWDTLSQKWFGNPNDAKKIIEVNRHVPITPRLPGGIRILIPIIEPSNKSTDTAKLPPWKK